MSEENPIRREIQETFKNFNEKNAVVYYETADTFRVLTYKDLEEISSTLRTSFEDFTKDCCVGLLMDHNPFIPSLISCLQNLNCCFTFLKSDLRIGSVETLEDIKIIISHNRPVDLPYYNFKCSINLLWEHKLYLYERQIQKEFHTDTNINYVVQTSGTTGIKKIVKVEHYCIYSNVRCLRSKLDITFKDVIYFGTILSFDPSMIELYLALMTGACLLIVSIAIKDSLTQLYKILFKNPNENHRISFLQMCPSVFSRWDEQEIDFILNNSNLRILLLGGETFPRTLGNLNRTRTRIFNIYGITEISCWASLEEFKFKDEISLGEPLDDTIFKVKNENGIEISHGDGELYIGSSKRICYVNNEIKQPLFRKTGDLVLIKNNKIFYKGRTNDIFKRYGIQLSSLYGENLIFESTQLENKLIYLESEAKLILFIKLNVSNKLLVVRICERVKIKLLYTLDKEYVPDYVEALLNFPINENGKIDKNKLTGLAREILVNKNNLSKGVTNEVEIFKKLWIKYFPVENVLNKTFHDLGGSSIMRLQFSNEYKELVKNDFPTHFFDYLFTNPYQDVIQFIKNYKFKIIDNKLINKKLKITRNTVEMKIKWSYDLKACVDAPPYIIQNKKFIAIGSFSNILAILNITNGEEISKVVLPNAIESSCLSTDSGEQIFVGCYNGLLYCIETNTGNIIWSYKTNDKIKNKPCFVNKAIIFGSYDKYLYCLKTETGALLWKTFLNCGVTAEPIYLKETRFIFVATINGTCFLINETGNILWNIKVESPIFTSPCIYENGDQIIIGEVQGILHCLNSKNGGFVWNYGIRNHIYSNIKIHGNLMFFTSHDCFIYCLEIVNDTIKLKFKIALDSASSSSVEIAKIKNVEYLITASINGTIYLIDLHEEIIVNKIQLGAEIFSSPVAYCNSDSEVLIFIGCRDNNLHCIEFVT